MGRALRAGSRGRGLILWAVLAFLVAAATASLVVALRDHAALQVSPGPPPPRYADIPGRGAYVPAYDLTSDPVFPTLEVGYAIESHQTSAGTIEHLARSLDGGRRWYLVGADFPFSSGYRQVQFVSVRTGYAFGRAGLAVTHDGGNSWQAGASLGGSLERVVPIGDNVWATYAVCHGPPEPTTPCQVRLAVSTDGGLSWATAGRVSPLSEAMAGGDILARYSKNEAFVVTYGPTGGGLAVTYDGGRSWRLLPDPCATWLRVDLAVVAHGQAWMVCGGSPALKGTSSAKAVLRSFDFARHWTLEAATGFGPPILGARDATAGVRGRLPYAGRLFQLATISPRRAWIGLSGLGVFVTKDAGRSWRLAEGMGPAAGEGGVGVTFDDARHGWAIVFNEGVWRTENAVSWQLIDGR